MQKSNGNIWLLENILFTYDVIRRFPFKFYNLNTLFEGEPLESPELLDISCRKHSLLYQDRFPECTLALLRRCQKLPHAVPQLVSKQTAKYVSVHFRAVFAKTQRLGQSNTIAFRHPHNAYSF